MEIQEGSTVYLKGDNTSTRMAVGSIKNGMAMCYWLDKKGNHTQGEFPLTVLTFDNPNPPHLQ